MLNDRRAAPRYGSSVLLPFYGKAVAEIRQIESTNSTQGYDVWFEDGSVLRFRAAAEPFLYLGDDDE